jgi:hypothetical protein
MAKSNEYPTEWTKEIAAALAKPFPDSIIKERPIASGLMAKYIDARAVEERLDEVVGPPNWSFTWLPVEKAVRGSLTVLDVTKEEAGYPNSNDDAEPFKSAVSDALKRCAVQFGVGRHLYAEDVVQSSGAERSQAPRKTQKELMEELKMDPAQVTPICDVCSNEMTLRKGSRGPFWGCSTYPDCKNLYNLSQVEIDGSVVKEKKESADPGTAGQGNEESRRGEGEEEIDTDEIPF